jgi:hypothetical protein
MSTSFFQSFNRVSPSSLFEKQTNAELVFDWIILTLDIFPYLENVSLIPFLLISSSSSLRVTFIFRLTWQSFMICPFFLHPKHSNMDVLSLTSSAVDSISLFTGPSFGFEFTLKFNHSEEIISFVLFLSLIAISEVDSVA